MYASVKGGTHAGWKTLREAIVPWTCECGKLNKFSRTCLSCGAKQP